MAGSKLVARLVVRLTRAVGDQTREPSTVSACSVASDLSSKLHAAGAERDLAGQHRRVIEGKAGPQHGAVARAGDTVVVDALVEQLLRQFSLDERRDDRGDLVAEAETAVELVVVAVALIDGLAGGRDGIVIDGPLGLAGDGEDTRTGPAIQRDHGMPVMDRRRRDRCGRKIRVGDALRAVIVAALETDVPAVGKIEPAGRQDLRRRQVGSAVAGVGHVGGAHGEGRGMARPVRFEHGLGRDP